MGYVKYARENGTMMIKCSVCKNNYTPMTNGFSDGIGFCVYCEKWHEATPSHEDLCMCVECLG